MCQYFQRVKQLCSFFILWEKGVEKDKDFFFCEMEKGITISLKRIFKREELPLQT